MVSCLPSPGQLGNPVRWLSTRRAVICLNRESPSVDSLGRYGASGSSSFSLPASTSFSTPYANTGLLSEPTLNLVSPVTGFFVSELRTPKLSVHTVRPPRIAAIESPGTPALSISAGMSVSS